MLVLTKTTQCLENYYVHAYEAWKHALESLPDVEVVNYGDGYPGFMGWNVSDARIYENIGRIPDVELWCGGPGNKKPQYIDGAHITTPLPEVPKLILLTDFWEIVRDCNVARWRQREAQLAAMGVVGYFSFYSQSQEWMKRVVGTRFRHFVEFPYVADERFFAPSNAKREWDVNLQMCINANYPFRSRCAAVVQGLPGVKCFRLQKGQLYKHIPGDKDPLNALFGAGDPTGNYAELLKRCKATVTDGYTAYSPQRGSWKLTSSDLFLARFSQTLASGCLLMCPTVSSTHIGPLVDGEHYVAINADNVAKKVMHYLKNEDERTRIAGAGREWALRNVSPGVVARSIVDQLLEIVG